MTSEYQGKAKVGRWGVTLPMMYQVLIPNGDTELTTIEGPNTFVRTLETTWEATAQANKPGGGCTKRWSWIWGILLVLTWRTARQQLRGNSLIPRFSLGSERKKVNICV